MAYDEIPGWVYRTVCVATSGPLARVIDLLDWREDSTTTSSIMCYRLSFWSLNFTDAELPVKHEDKLYNQGPYDARSRRRLGAGCLKKPNNSGPANINRKLSYRRETALQGAL